MQLCEPLVAPMASRTDLPAGRGRRTAQIGADLLDGQSGMTLFLLMES